jgi:hypothetical protein
LTTQALTASDSHLYDGLQCLRWEREATQVRFEAFNFTGGCEVHWVGRLASKSGGVDLVLSDPSCNVAACGSCLYDAAFEIDAERTALDESAKVDLKTAPCDGPATVIASWQLQPGDGASGLHCSYPRALVDHAGRLGLCGKRDMPCRDRCGDRQSPACDPGLVCNETSESSFTCLAECNKDDDCRLPEVMTCSEGLCRLRNP